MMSLTAINTSNLTMSSRVIAELTGKEHKNVLRVIRDLISLNILSAQIEPLKFEYRGQQFDYFELDKRDSLVLVARLSPEFTAVIVDRWQELESKKSPAVPRTYAEALLEAGRLALEVEKQAEQLAVAAPKVAFVDNYVDAGGSKSLRETAKILRMPERAMIETLIRDRVLYRQSGNLLPYSERQKSGLFTVKTGQAETLHAFTQTRVTPRGLSWLAQNYASELMVN